MENRTEKKTVPTVDMTGKCKQYSLPVSDRIFWQTAAEAETGTAQRQHAYHVAAH